MGMAMEQGLQGVPGTFNPPIQGHQAMLTGSWTASYWPSLLETSVPVLSVIRRGSVAMEVFTALFAVFVCSRQYVCSGFEVFPHQAYPSVWNSVFEMGREA